jgi:hypothetical protein
MRLHSLHKGQVHEALEVCEGELDFEEEDVPNDVGGEELDYHIQLKRDEAIVPVFVYKDVQKHRYFESK